MFNMLVSRISFSDIIFSFSGGNIVVVCCVELIVWAVFVVGSLVHAVASRSPWWHMVHAFDRILHA